MLVSCMSVVTIYYLQMKNVLHLHAMMIVVS
jgi:hypothetical protein